VATAAVLASCNCRPDKHQPGAALTVICNTWHVYAPTPSTRLQVAALRAQLAGLIRASQAYSQQRDAEAAQAQTERASLQGQLAVAQRDAGTSRQVLSPLGWLLIGIANSIQTVPPPAMATRVYLL
jgi:hypothetical protein